MAVLAVVLTMPGPEKLKLVAGVLLKALKVTVVFTQSKTPMAIKFTCGVWLSPITIVVAVAVHPSGVVAVTV